MKKVFSVILAGVLLLSFMGCESKPTPESTVTNFIEAVKTNNAEELEKQPISVNDEVSAFQDLSTEEDELINEEVLLSVYSSIEYEIKDIKISEDGKTATVDVTITNSNFGEAISNFYSDIFVIAFGGYDEKEAEKKGLEALETRIKEVKEKDPVTTNATVKLTKNDDDTWQIDQKGNEDFANALTGGMFKATEELTDAFN